MLRKGIVNYFDEKKCLDTKDLATDFCAIPGGKGGKFKWPTLTELYVKLFDHAFAEAHDAAFDVDATAKAFFELLRRHVIQVPECDPSLVVYEAPVLDKSNFTEVVKPEASAVSSTEQSFGTAVFNGEFVHLHVHSQYSVLQSTMEIDSLIKRAKEWAKEGQQPLHPAEVRPIGVDATAAVAGIKMTAPAIRSHQIHVGGPLLGVKGCQGFATAFGVEATTGAAATDALPKG
jgi:hypothetical protein